MSFLIFYPRMRPLDTNGLPMNGCYLKFFQTGTTTPTPVYAADGVTPLGVKITANSAGAFPAIYGDNTVVYRMQLYGPESIPGADDGVLISDDDPVNPTAAFPTGTVVMFNGTSGARDAAYPPSLWALCDGSLSTPDSRDRGPVGVSGTKPINTTGGGGGGLTGPSGAHDHTGVTAGHALTSAENGPHIHTGLNSVPFSKDDNSQSPYTQFEGSAEQADGTANFATITTASSGSGTAHTHGITGAVDHQHTVAVQSPYFTIWFLQRK